MTVVEVRSYSLISGRTSLEIEITMPGARAVTISLIILSCEALA